ncbi:HAD-IIA family hydrolase [Cumulibacter manganitolerans]|uniref:HAD-IIA family hydrolase n=1 Tax=Cumulibacter manganitolerans TaxID=1884992 RepID=UPI001296BC14|nr:HAD-IIA family hydrolase [Cumulibacter manganitolerans]
MTPDPLCEHYDVGLFDLDGVVYAGSRPIPHAADSIAAARRAGMRAGYVTNNASRTPEDVAAKLADVGVEVDVAEIITSAQVAAQLLAERLRPGSRVLVVGDVGLREAVAGAGLEPVDTAEVDPGAVVQGHSPHTGWILLSEATIAIRAGALWVATNTDSTLPTDRGILPGNGAFVSVIGNVLGRRPDAVAGKPDRAMHRASVERTGARRPLVIGDRLDTDIEGATSSECDSLYVMTGVSRPLDVLHATPAQRPTYIGSDLRALLRPGLSIADAGQAARAGRWRTDDSGIRAGDDPAGDDDTADYATLACALAWTDRSCRPADETARAVAASLGLADES